MEPYLQARFAEQPPVPRDASQSASAGAVPSATPLRDRLIAGGVHLLLSAAVGAAVLALVFLAWYPDPLHELIGVGTILVLMLGIDVVLGPLCTAIVFDRRKRSLRFDLATIAVVQLAALLYGVWTVHQGRAGWVVFVKDRFEIVAPAEVDAREREASGSPVARLHPLRPTWIAATMPGSAQERSAMLFDALSKGRDVQHHPKLWVEYDSQARSVVERSLPLARLRSLNPGREDEIARLAERLGRPETGLRFLPVHGPARDGAAIVDRRDGSLLAVSTLTPW